MKSGKWRNGMTTPSQHQPPVPHPCTTLPPSFLYPRLQRGKPCPQPAPVDAEIPVADLRPAVGNEGGPPPVHWQNAHADPVSKAEHRAPLRGLDLQAVLRDAKDTRSRLLPDDLQPDCGEPLRRDIERGRRLVRARRSEPCWCNQPSVGAVRRHERPEIDQGGVVRRRPLLLRCGAAGGQHQHQKTDPSPANPTPAHAARVAFLRSCSVKSFLRMRINFGVTSTNSSSLMTSSENSS